MTDQARRDLEELRTRLDEEAAAGNAHAAEVRDRIDGYLAASDRDEDEHKAFLDHLGDAALRFEFEHPRLSHTLQGVIDSLTAAGI